MIPNIFISSTISDLTYLRDSIRDLIQEIGYIPVMSEYGDIGYLPTNSAEDSCYITMKQCQLAILIIGKRYGSLSKNNLSVTHNEFKTAIKNKVPVIFLVDKEMLSFLKIFESNDGKINIPGVEDPSKSFGFIREFVSLEINNGIVPFSNTQSAKENLKKQLAHIFGDLLKTKFDPIKNEIKDILSEVTTIKHVLLKNEKQFAQAFLNIFRHLLDEKNRYLKVLCETISGSLETASKDLSDSATFTKYFEQYNIEIRLVPNLLDLFDARDQSVVDAFNANNVVYDAFPEEFTNAIKSNNEAIVDEAVNALMLEYVYGKKLFVATEISFKFLNTLYNSVKSIT